MRVSTAQMYSSLLAGVKQQQNIQNLGNAQISSGTRFQTPTQAGIDYKISLDIRHAQVGLQGDLEAINTAETRLNNSMSTLNNMSNVLKRVQSIAVKVASVGVSATERLSSAMEVSHLMNQLISDANQQWQGQSLFAGTATDKPAFAADTKGNIIYQGNSNDRVVSTNNGQQITTNVRGDNPAFSDTFTAMQNLKTALTNNDQAGVKTAIGAITTASDKMINATSDVGARLTGVRLSKTAIEDRQLNLQKQLSTHEGVDAAAVVTRLQESNIALQATYGQISRLKSLSLTNFLR